ncbi:MAG: SUMF1/EgtB/PvdO family nonheme iron enzyme [Bacteroidales bacterium]|nr:SUMF1/EgtB/PvdO family nonheme iron enzyme [Bacteroidales bacterium]
MNTLHKLWIRAILCFLQDFQPKRIFQNHFIIIPRRIFLWAAFLVIFSLFRMEGVANNLTVSNIALSGQDYINDFTQIQFDISWENSWRNSSGTTNWDAAWVFVKYRIEGESNWNHVTLNWVDGSGSGDGHTEPSGSNIASSNDNGSGGAYGVFIHRSSDGTGTFSLSGVKLRWNYGVDGLEDNDEVEISVMAIEMVYVPQGSFYVGDGEITSISGHFETNTTGAAFQITSEDEIVLGGGGMVLHLGNNNASNMGAADDFNDATSKTLPAGFPKGYDAFYCMKYEISQGQYVEFLNRLTRAQQDARTGTNLAVGVTNSINTYVMSNSLTMNYRNGIRCDDVIDGSEPITFYCDYDGDGVGNESNDGQFIACNYVNWADLVAYLDWAGLRPMTELEFEKACRGNQTAQLGEYPWGSTLIGASSISNPGEATETAYNAGAMVAFNNSLGVQGPMRGGNFGQGVNTRAGVGAGYYGIMELAGNIVERCVTVGNANGREFTGNNGNGAVAANGNADVAYWPGTNSVGAGFRGGSFGQINKRLRVSDRFIANYPFANRDEHGGGRGVRTAP